MCAHVYGASFVWSAEGEPVVVSKEQRRSMGAKFSVLPQRYETAAQMSERGTLAVYSERVVLIGSKLVVRRHGGGGAPSGGAHGSAPVGIPKTGIATTPLTQPRRGEPKFEFYYWFLLHHP